jgi:RNA polymerase sigma factor (sigma-70 family)
VSAVSPAAPASHAAALYERHRGRVLRFCQSRLGSREDAEDATQTTFMNAVGALRRGTVPHAEAAWLLRIAENVCHHRHRTAARRAESACDPTVLEDVVEAAPGPPDELIHLAAALESLPERQRLAVLLREWQGLSYDEIGTELGLSHSAVETLLFRGRRGLAQALEHDGRRRHGLGLASVLGWLKTAAGGTVAVKVAAAVVVAGVAIVPIGAAPPPRPAPDAQPRAAVVEPAVATTAPARPQAAIERRRASAPSTRPAARKRPAPGPLRPERRPVAEAAPTPAPAPATVTAEHTAPRAAATAAEEPKRDTPLVSVPTPLVDPTALPPLPVPTVPELEEAVPPLPALPELPKLPDVPVPELPLPSLP